METTFKLQKVEDFKHLVITHDMTKLEREQCKNLVANFGEGRSSSFSKEQANRWKCVMVRRFCQISPDILD